MAIPSTRRVTAVALSSLLALGLAACGGGEGGASDKTDAPIKIGASLPLTGEFSQPGKAAKEGYEVWQKMINESGGLHGRKVELVIKDDASNQNTIVTDYNALISQDKVDLLLGTFSSLLNLPASAVAERNQMLYVEPAGASPKIFSRGFKYTFFSQQATADKQGVVFANWIAGLPADQRPKTAAYPTIDDPFAVPTVEGIKAILEKAGIQTVYEQTYAIDTKNFDTIVNAMKAKAPDLVVHGAVFEDGVGMTRAMLKADFKPHWLYQTSTPSNGDQYANAVGVQNTEGVMYAVSHAPQANTPGNKEFVAKYKEMYGGLPPEDAADAFAAGQVLKAAVDAVGNVKDQAAMADWLRKNSVETILGTLKWNADGSPIGQFLIGQWQKGKVEFVLPKESATTDNIIMGWKPGGAGQ
ncbi:amino acid ABC transporter substrate-binding protein [Micromonospora sp. NPDC005806]|uniref:amino acid ABC transporter substrate-binding protein n=1 Tax=Micromonospora sp. NPDC005806 TaxID=3364234 RepID=UPI0036A4F9A0